MTVLIFGATGAAGGSVLRACLSAPSVTEVRTITRRPLRASDPKLRAWVHGDYLDYSAVQPAFMGVEACFFCLGISVSQVSGEPEYRKITHSFALAAARALKAASPAAVFHYVSGKGAGLKSPLMWARVKAEAEKDLIDLVDALAWRPASIDGEPSDNGPKLYRTLQPVLRLMKPFRGLYIKGEDLGRAMLQATAENVRGRVIENAEIRDIADRARV
jgi:uncharacterized protein YbjT (DUF2867 family)